MFKSVILLYYNNTINIENFISQISREYQFAISKVYLNNFNEKKYQSITTCEKDSKDELPISKITKTFRRMHISRASCSLTFPPFVPRTRLVHAASSVWQQLPTTDFVSGSKMHKLYYATRDTTSCPLISQHAGCWRIQEEKRVLSFFFFLFSRRFLFNGQQ